MCSERNMEQQAWTGVTSGEAGISQKLRGGALLENDVARLGRFPAQFGNNDFMGLNMYHTLKNKKQKQSNYYKGLL